MKYLYTKTLFVIFLFFASSFQLIAKDKDPEWAKKVGSAKLKFKKQEFLANHYGAKADTTFLSSVAIQKAIDACAEAGGGYVTLNPGRYLIGSIFVKSNVKLRI